MCVCWLQSMLGVTVAIASHRFTKIVLLERWSTNWRSCLDSVSWLNWMRQERLDAEDSCFNMCQTPFLHIWLSYLIYVRISKSVCCRHLVLAHLFKRLRRRYLWQYLTTETTATIATARAVKPMLMMATLVRPLLRWKPGLSMETLAAFLLVSS